MPSYGGAHGPDGSKKTGDQGQGTRDRNGGATGGLGRDLAAERSRLRAAGATTITPKYGWDDASFSDFSILGGGVRGLFDTIVSGKTYAGRTPQGLVGGGIGAAGGGRQGGNGGLGEKLNISQILAQLKKLQAPAPVAAPAAPPQPTLTDYASKYLSVNAPGLEEYGIWTPFQRA